MFIVANLSQQHMLYIQEGWMEILHLHY